VTCHRSVVFSGPPVSSTNKTDRYDITEILLKVALNSTDNTVEDERHFLFSCNYHTQEREALMSIINENCKNFSMTFRLEMIKQNEIKPPHGQCTWRKFASSRYRGHQGQVH
jgi:hypothetical protein